MKKIIILLFLHSLFLFSAEIPQEIQQCHIVPKYTTPQARLSSRLTSNSLLACDRMPSGLHDKIFQKKLARQCIFLSSVYEKDYDTVLWILDHDITYQKKAMPDGTIRPEKDRFFYYSVYSSDYRQGCFTPFMVANHLQDERMLQILEPIFSDKYNLKKQRLLISNKMPYELYKIACLKQDPLLHIEDFKKLELDVINAFSEDFGPTFSHTHFFFLVAMLNNDKRLFNFMVRVCDEDYPIDENDLMSKDVLSDLGLIFKGIVTIEDKHATCFTREEIKKIIEHPFVDNQKNFILNSVSYSLYYGSINDDRSNDPVLKLVEQLLMQKGAQTIGYPKLEKHINNNNQWKFSIIISKKGLLITTFVIGLSIYLISLGKKLFLF